ncbi:MAG: glutaredoxin domain-containing protein [Methanosarcina sp.]|nr:glutaredoxin domain-containing protein [Methanosarcina sp.]
MITIYSDTNCQGCKALISFLNNKNIQYAKILISDMDIDSRNAFIARAKAFGTLALPIIEYDGRLITRDELIKLVI